MLSKSNMIALKTKRTMNLSYQLYNMMVFQKMERLPTKNKENPALHTTRKLNNIISLYTYIVMP